MAELRIYTDTSVIGGCFDEKFAGPSKRLFSYAREGRIRVLLSAVTLREVAPAPVSVRNVLDDLPDRQLEIVPINREVQRLVHHYLNRGIVSPKWRDDATHVAAATVAGADAIVSWNFKHIAQVDRIRAYNEVNGDRGFPPLTIISPLEVDYGSED